MKNWTKLLVILTVAVAFVFAQDVAKIGYIYSEQIMVEYQEAVDAMKKLEAEAVELQKVFEEMQQDYQKLVEDYEKRKMVSSEAWKKQKQNEIVAKEQQLQQYQLANFGQDGEIYKKEETYLAPVLNKINEVLKRVGQEKGYSYIIDASKGSIVYADEALDITNLILEELKKSN